jgi:hypothetical protein
MNKAFVRSAAATMILGALAAPARADDADGWHLAVGLDVLTVGNAGKHNLDAAKKFCTAQVLAGATSCAGTVATSGAYGGRLGAYYQSGAAYAGPSVGYLYGGPTAMKETVTTVPAGTLSRKTTDNTGRLLLEFGAKLPLDDSWALGLGAGAGAALVSEKSACTDSGALAGTCAASGFKPSVKMGWATWELSPSVQYRAVELGFRYVGFGRKKYPAWSTFGLFVGGRF